MLILHEHSFVIQFPTASGWGPNSLRVRKLEKLLLVPTADRRVNQNLGV